MSDDQGSASASSRETEVILEGSLLKLSRNRVWQERYFVFSSNQVLSYYHRKGEKEPRASFRITKESGCELSDLYVEQRQRGSGKEQLYCINFSWTDDSNTIASVDKNYPFRDDASFFGGFAAGVAPSPTPEPSSPVPKSSKLPNPLSVFKSPRRAKQKLRRHRSGSPPKDEKSAYGDENSMSSIGTPHKKSRQSWFRRGDSNSVGSLDKSLTNFELESVGSNRNSKGKISRMGNGVPSFVDMGPPLSQEYETILEGSGEKSPVKVKESRSGSVDFLDVKERSRSPRTSRVAPEKGQISRTGSDEKAAQVPYGDQNAAEQEKLLGQYLDYQKVKKKKSREKAVENTKMAVAAGTAVGVGVLTAGVGVAAGLVFLGAAAAAGGTASVAETTLFGKKGGRLTIATTSYDEAKLWMASLEACLQVGNIKDSTWGQMFMADGRKTTSALMPHDIDMKSVMSREGDDGPVSEGRPPRSMDLPKGQTGLFLKERDFLAQKSARWRPLEGGWVSFLGPGAQSIRIFREEKIRTVESESKVSKLAVGGSTCTPLKTQVVLSARPLDAFMCLMSYGRILSPPNNPETVLEPNSGQSASFRLVEKINDHMDVVHLVCRKLYLFPSWTESRDFVLFRYWRYEPDGSYIVCYESVEHESCPPQPGFVRGEMHQVCTVAPSKASAKRRKGSTSTASECLLTAVVQVDPKGWVPNRPMPFLSNQTYSDAFGINALLGILDIRDAIVNDRFLNVASELQSASGSTLHGNSLRSASRTRDVQVNYDLRFANRERCDSLTSNTLSGLETNPPPLDPDKWAEPDANSFIVRGPNYKNDKVKINAGASIGRLVAVDLVLVDKPIMSGMATHPEERIQRALRREAILKASGKESDMPPFVFMVNIILPGPPFYHAVYYYAVDDMSTIDGSDGTGSSLLCKDFLFGDSDDFRDRTFKLIPQIVEGNFMVRKAVGSTPAIMGTKLKQYYSRDKRFLEIILDCGSSAVATGVIRLSLGYAKTLMVDMGFLLEGDCDEHLPERIFGCARMKYPEFGPNMLRKVEPPPTT